jgi:hypothetical protein
MDIFTFLKQELLSTALFLITPPFTQLNTPYPATAYLKGFLNTRGIGSFQADLGIETTLALFSQRGLTDLFEDAQKCKKQLSANATRILALKDDYLQTIENVILFLQGKSETMAHLLSKRYFLPEAGRFAQIDDMDWAFGSMGVQDKAKHFCTMYLEDLSDLITETVDEHFGFSMRSAWAEVPIVLMNYTNRCSDPLVLLMDSC